MKTIIHVNQHNIKENSKGENKPVLTCKTYKSNTYSNEAIIYGCDGLPAARVVYSPEKTLSCGAKVWIETDNEVRYSLNPGIDEVKDEDNLMQILLEDQRMFSIFSVDVSAERGEDNEPIYKIYCDSDPNLVYGTPLYESESEVVKEESIEICSKEFSGEFGIYSMMILYRVGYDYDGFRGWNYLEYVNHKIESFIPELELEREEESFISLFEL
jgi:hypothetical protein